MVTVNNVSNVAPALDKYAKGALSALWERQELAPRDRSIVTIAALIAHNQTIEMPRHFHLTLDNGVKPSNGLILARDFILRSAPILASKASKKEWISNGFNDFPGRTLVTAGGDRLQASLYGNVCDTQTRIRTKNGWAL